MTATGADEDDYLNMVFDDSPSVSLVKPESSLQRTQRLKREAASRAHQPRKKDLEAQAASKRQAVLDTALDSSSIGAKMLAKMGFKEGGTLGKSEDALREPIRVEMRAGKGGLGITEDRRSLIGGAGVGSSRTAKRYHDELERSEEARSSRDATAARLQTLPAAASPKRPKVSESEYRERTQVTAEERQNHGKLMAAMKVLETLETSVAAQPGKESGEKESSSETPPTAGAKRPSLRSVNVLRRRLARDRLEEECEQKAHILKAQSFALRGSSGEVDDIRNPKHAFILDARAELNEDDPELDEFEELSMIERLEKVVLHLRKEHNYCFWCMGAYPDNAMDGCPGTSEDEHG